MPAPNPTKFVNWGRYFSANKDAATSQAEKMAARQRAAAVAAQKTTSGLVGQFAGQAGVAPGTAQPITSPSTNVGTASLGGNVGNVMPGAVQVPVGATPRPPQPAAQTPEEQLAEAEKNALVGYTGPDELSDLAGTEAAYTQNLEAQKGLNLLGSEEGIQSLSGESKFGSALTATAGRGKFDALRGQFSLQKDWEDAETKAKALAERGTAKAKSQAMAWQEKAERLKVLAASGLDPNRKLAYGSENVDEGPAGRGITKGPDYKPNVDPAVQARREKNHTESYSSFAGGVLNDNARFGLSQKQFESMSPEERAQLDDLVEQNADNTERSAFAAKIKAKYGKK